LKEVLRSLKKGFESLKKGSGVRKKLKKFEKGSGKPSNPQTLKLSNPQTFKPSNT